MSLNVSGSKYIKVYDPTIRLNYSDKVLWANLVSSRKTGAVKIDGETGGSCCKSQYGKGSAGKGIFPLGSKVYRQCL